MPDIQIAASSQPKSEPPHRAGNLLLLFFLSFPQGICFCLRGRKSKKQRLFRR
jgi:hypothetical protein